MKNIGSKVKEKREKYNHYERNYELEKDNQHMNLFGPQHSTTHRNQRLFGFPNLTRRKTTQLNFFHFFKKINGKRFIILHKKPLFWTQHASVSHSIHIYESLFSYFLTQIL